MNLSGKKVLVTGATGTIGPELLCHLKSGGYRMRVLMRQESRQSFAEDIEVVRADLLDSHQSLRKAVKGIDVVFHLAAKLHISEPSPNQFLEYQKINVDATRSLLSAAEKEGVGRFVFFSTINVLGATDGISVLDETSPLRPETIYARTKVEAENIVRQFPSAVILRLAAVYGPEMKGNYPKLVRSLQKGYFFHIGDGLNRRTLVHVGDVCKAALLAAEHPQAAGELFHVTDGRIHSMNDIVAAICAGLGKSAPKTRIPAWIVKMIARVVQNAFTGLGKIPPISVTLIDKFIEDVAVRGERIQAKLGFQPEYDLKSGWCQVIRSIHQ